LRGVNMIFVHLIGHNFEYEVREMIRVFFFNEEIKFIDDLKEYDEGILIVSKFNNTFDKLASITQIYDDNQLVYDDHLDIDTIDIGRDDIHKKIRVGIITNLYNGLNRISPVKAPWGILTGVRPLKIVHDLLDKNYDYDSIIDILTKGYKLFSEKAELLLNIAKKQRKYLYPLDDRRFSLYIAIPFCPTRCVYCSFPSCSIDKFGHMVDMYTDKLIYEIDEIGKLMADYNISTVYIGGGTPTAIPIKNLERIIQAVYRNFGKENIEEFTVEAGRPDTINYEMLSMLKDNHIDRISINPQTMNDRTLELIGRKHTSSDIIDVYHMAKNIGFPVINMDLIVGLPAEGVKEIRTTLSMIEKLDPENLTVHTLAVKRGSKFKDIMDQYQLKEQNIINEMLNETKIFAERMGLEPYYLYRQKQMLGNLENIGYAKKDKECLYNIKMMEEKETIIAAGMGAISKIYYPQEDRIERVPNVKSLKEYIDRVDEMIEKKRSFLS